MALKEASKVVDLEDKLQIVQRHMDRTEMEAAQIVDELQGDMAQFKIVDSKKAEEIKELEGTIENLERKIKFMEIESTKLISIVSSNESELEASSAKIESLVKLTAEQEEKHLSLRSELEMLIGAYDRSKNDNSRKVTTLQNEIKELKKISTNEATRYQEDYSKLQELANTTEERIDQQTEEYRRVEEELEGKTKIINDMVNDNELLGKDQKQMRKLVTELQEENESFLQETGLLKTKSLALETELGKKKSDHFTELKKEALLRQGVDSKVNTLKSEILAMKKECHSYAELEAKNFLLQDKVERQENYLKKRLHEQSRKNQPFGSAPSPIRPSMGRPRSPSLAMSGRRRSPSPARRSMGGFVPPVPRTAHSKTRRKPVIGGKQDELGLLLDDV